MKTDLNEEWFHLFEIHTLTDSDQNWCESKSDQYSLFNKIPNRLTLFKNLLAMLSMSKNQFEILEGFSNLLLWFTQQGISKPL